MRPCASIRMHFHCADAHVHAHSVRSPCRNSVGASSSVCPVQRVLKVGCWCRSAAQRAQQLLERSASIARHAGIIDKAELHPEPQTAPERLPVA